VLLAVGVGVAKKAETAFKQFIPSQLLLRITHIASVANEVHNAARYAADKAGFPVRHSRNRLKFSSLPQVVERPLVGRKVENNCESQETFRGAETQHQCGMRPRRRALICIIRTSIGSRLRRCDDGRPATGDRASGAARFGTRFAAHPSNLDHSVANFRGPSYDISPLFLSPIFTLHLLFSM
jgi:hypothetical protein